MTQKEILEKIRPVFAWQLGVPEERIQRTARFHEDLGADELDVVVLASDVEGTFDITVNENALFWPSIDRAIVWDAIRYIQRRLKKEHR